MFVAASFNTNSIRARLGIILNWLKGTKPDVLCLQETKVEDKHFPVDSFREAGYNTVFTGRKSYNGVAIISPHPIEKVHTGIGDWAEPGEARLIMATIKGLPVVNTYIPQGRHPRSEVFGYKINWIRAMRDFFDRHYSPSEPLLWAGDFNVAPEPIDVYDAEKLHGRIGYHPEEHKALQYVKDWGFVDAFRLHVTEGGAYTFWDYRVPRAIERSMGWRVDHVWATEPLARLSHGAWIDMSPRLAERPSDHTFIAASFDW